jgi:hypothetical protein
MQEDFTARNKAAYEKGGGAVVSNKSLLWNRWQQQ